MRGGFVTDRFVSDRVVKGAAAFLTAVVLAVPSAASAQAETHTPPQPRSSAVDARAVTPAGPQSGTDAGADAALAGTVSGTLPDWIRAVDSGLAEAGRALSEGREGPARTAVLRVYLDYFEPIEGFYGSGGVHADPALAVAVGEAEAGFHALLQGGGSPEQVDALRSDVAAVLEEARAAGVPLSPEAPTIAATAAGPLPTASSPEIGAIMAELGAADRAYREGRASEAMAHVETAYLEGFEPLEARLPSGLVSGIERLFHLTVRPAIASGEEPEVVTAGIQTLGQRLAEADEALAADASLWLGAVNSFAIIVREGLEAVLLIGALLAYLGAAGAGAERRRQIYWGAGIGIGASVLTWGIARTLIPIGGAGRELVEGITGLVAVVVLLYVSNWLAQKTYIHDWKTYLREKVDQAVGAGSGFAMASLAFAAVYREGFETVLFYQALLFETGPGPVLLGFVAGSVLIAAVAVGIIRMGLRLPLRKVFAVTNAILVYLAFTFLGKSLYNLQEAGLFAPEPVAWAPDSGILRQLFGFYPTVETMLAQAAFLALVAGTYGVYRWRGAKRRRAMAGSAEQVAAA